MKKFVKGDILWGTKKAFDEAWHPIVYIEGSADTPLAVVLTHNDEFTCNIPLTGKYGQKSSYFVAHLIEKMAAWGPYKKNGALTANDINLIEQHIYQKAPMTWDEYLLYTRNGCPDHP